MLLHPYCPLTELPAPRVKDNGEYVKPLTTEHTINLSSFLITNPNTVSCPEKGECRNVPLATKIRQNIFLLLFFLLFLFVCGLELKDFIHFNVTCSILNATR